jgi:hypothetical protein
MSETTLKAIGAFHSTYATLMTGGQCTKADLTSDDHLLSLLACRFPNCQQEALIRVHALLKVIDRHGQMGNNIALMRSNFMSLAKPVLFMSVSHTN